MPNLARSQEFAWMSDALHDLCQPLTALECRLVLATMSDQRGLKPGEQELRQAVQESLAECARLMAKVREMQDRLQE